MRTEAERQAVPSRSAGACHPGYAATASYREVAAANGTPAKRSCPRASPRHLIEAFVRGLAEIFEADSSTIAALTGRERDVLTFVAKGLSNAEIGDQHYVSPAAVKTHVARILK
jgi:DNA-binding NarL/FixJ family response regulator